MANFDMRGLLIRLFVFLSCFSTNRVFSAEILSKSKLERCETSSDSRINLNCTKKIVINMAVPSGSSGGEASIVAEVVEVEENSTDKMQTLRIPPSITINKSPAYALYELIYIRDVPFKPEELYVQTRKCEPDADEKVVQFCERLYNSSGQVIPHTQPTCCPCGDQRRVPSSCGNFFDNLLRGKPNTAHCVRFDGDWFHVYGVGQRSIGFNVKIKVTTESKTSEVSIGPENRTATSDDKFLRVNLVGDFAGYTNIPTFDDFYLVTPRQGVEGKPADLGNNFSMWMLLERVRFTLDGYECNKIGVSYETFNAQPDFCSSPMWSCLRNQLWNFFDADQNRLSRNQVPFYRVEHRFERINQHPNAGSHSFSIGITEVLNTNLLIELRADDIEYVNQRSTGKVCSITTPTFEALSQSGTSTITVMNTGDVEASYSLTFSCLQGVTEMEEQYFIMKPKEMMTRSFKIYPNTDQAAKHTCTAILKDSEFNEVDRADCQFTTTATVLENGTQVAFVPPKSDTPGFFDSIRVLWNRIWNSLIGFITGDSCRRSTCNSFFDFRCHIQYLCLSWIILFVLFLAIFPMVLLLLWLLHQKGLFDSLYDCWEDHCMKSGEDRYRNRHRHNRTHLDRFPIKHHRHKRDKIHDTHRHHRQHHHHEHKHREKGSDYYLHHVQKGKQKHHGHKRQHAHQKEERRKHGKGGEAINRRRNLVEEMEEYRQSPQMNHLRRRE